MLFTWLIVSVKLIVMTQPVRFVRTQLHYFFEPQTQTKKVDYELESINFNRWIEKYLQNWKWQSDKSFNCLSTYSTYGMHLSGIESVSHNHTCIHLMQLLQQSFVGVALAHYRCRAIESDTWAWARINSTWFLIDMRHVDYALCIVHCVCAQIHVCQLSWPIYTIKRLDDSINRRLNA